MGDQGEWKRVADALGSIETVIDRPAMLHVDRWLRARTDQQIKNISKQMNFGWRGLGQKKQAKTQRRNRARAMILLAHVRGQAARVNEFSAWRKSKTRQEIAQEIQNYWTQYNPPAHNDPAPDLPAAANRNWNQRLLQDRLDMLAHVAITPPHDGESRVQNVNNDFTTLEVTANRVQYASLAPNNLQQGALSLVRPKNVTALGDFAIYWLPWKDRHIIKVRLLLGPNTPSVFFTSQIGGCSVFVQGPANQPTAYHAGIDGELEKVDQADLPGQPRSQELINAARDSDAPTFWHVLLERNENVNIATANIGEVSRADYVRDGSFWQKTKATKGTLSFIERVQDVHEPQGMKITNIIPFGCVFGLKTAGNWRFYLQKNITMQYRQTKTKPVRSWTATFPYELIQVFPTTPQRVSMIPKFCRMPWLFVQGERVRRT